MGLSLLPHLMAFTPKSGQPAQGELFEVRCLIHPVQCWPWTVHGTVPRFLAGLSLAAQSRWSAAAELLQ